MKIGKKFYWRKDISKDNNLEFIILGYNGDGSPETNMEVWVVPSKGSNMCRFSMGGMNVIDFDPELLLISDYTGTPVLYPTPNRVRNGMFQYNGVIYNQVKRGEPVFEHGLVHNEPWQFNDPDVRDDSVSLKTWIDFNPKTDVFAAFPFIHRLSMEFTLLEDGVEVMYSIENKDDREIPFGFGVHPYFMKLSGESETLIRLPANYVMDYTSDLLPTGRLIEVDDTIYDIKKETKISALDLDHVFTGISEGKYAEIKYSSLGMKVELQASEDFTHLVLYSPAGKEFFCVENQTCSTDAHNLFERGFKSQSGLKFVSPGKTRQGTVKYAVKRGE
jgi:aldose 1-epimerase